MKQIADITTVHICPQCGDNYKLRVSVAEKQPNEGQRPEACSSLLERHCSCTDKEPLATPV